MFLFSDAAGPDACEEGAFVYLSFEHGLQNHPVCAWQMYPDPMVLGHCDLDLMVTPPYNTSPPSETPPTLEPGALAGIAVAVVAFVVALVVIIIVLCRRLARKKKENSNLQKTVVHTRQQVPLPQQNPTRLDSTINGRTSDHYMNPNALIEDTYIQPRPFEIAPSGGTGAPVYTITQDDSIYTATRDDDVGVGYIQPLDQPLDRTGDAPRFSVGYIQPFEEVNRMPRNGPLDQRVDRPTDASRLSVGYIEPPQGVQEVRRSPRNSPRRSPRNSPRAVPKVVPRLEPSVEPYPNIPRESLPHIYESLDSIQREYATLGKLTELR